MEYNVCQSSIELETLDKEVVSELLDFIETVPFIRHLISSDRKYSRDLEKDELGRVKVDITKPHILENTDYFRPGALFYQKFKKYTNLFPNSSPNSEYFRFWKEEARRCREGFIREEDGEWITGPHYFYLNYSPILRSVIKKGSRRAERIRDFPDFYDGDYLYFHYLQQATDAGKHVGLLKKRGMGFSFKAGSDLARLLILGDTSVNKGDVKGFAIASEKEYLIKDGILNKFEDNVDWCASNTPWPRLKSKNSLNSMTWEMGYVDSSGLTQGTRNSVIGVTTQGAPDKARGKRGPRIYWDEWGKHPNLLKSWMVARESVEEGNFAFGTMVGGGTGGTEGADFKGAEEMFYNPGGYNILELPNVYDKNVNGSSTCAFFFPAYLNRLGRYDKSGNSDVLGSLIEIIQRRVYIKYNSTDSNTLVQHKAEMCIIPQEAIMRREGSIFPVADLKDYLAEIMPDMPKFTGAHYLGHLKTTIGGGISWDKQELHPVLRNYPLRDELDKNGAIEIFEMPNRLNSSGTIPFWRYIAGIDPIDSDEGTYTNSLGSIFIFDTWTDRIVAEYTGRPRLAVEFYENCVKLLKFYNAIANYENNLKGLFQYFDSTRNLQYLCDTPQILRDMDYAKGTAFGNRAKGTSANKMINAWGRKLQADWLISPSYSPFEEDEAELDENGKIIEKPAVLNLHRVRSLGYIRELISWNPDDNFDRVSAMGMLMILRAEREKFEQHKYEDKIKTIVDDPWFLRYSGISKKAKTMNPAKDFNGLRYTTNKNIPLESN
jgi:hypothetical protein